MSGSERTTRQLIEGALGRRRFTQGAATSVVAVAIAACGSSSDDPSQDGTEGGTGSADGSTSGSGSASGTSPTSPTDPSSDGSTSNPTGDGSTSGGNGAPIWAAVPTITFVQGVPSEVSVGEYVSDPDGDALALMLSDVALPDGVTFDADGMRFVYDGSGATATTSGHVLTADDGVA